VRYFHALTRENPARLLHPGEQAGFLQLEAPIKCPKCGAGGQLEAMLHKDGSPCECPHNFLCLVCNNIFWIPVEVAVEKRNIITGGP